MQHRKGDLFTTDAQIIAHGANTKGAMGAGIAKTVRDKFPDVYKGYHHYCKNGMAVPGEWYAAIDKTNPDKAVVVLNLFTQDLPGPNASYAWVAESLLDFVDFYMSTSMGYGNVIAIPEIGSGIGGLDYKNVEKILQLVEDIYPSIGFEVWHYVGS